MNILFFSVFILFSVLILRLGVVQIVKGEMYREEVERTDETSVSFSVPRGEIYDRNHGLLVYNIPEKAITYTPPKHPRAKDLLEVAKKLSQYIQMTEDDMKKVRERDLKDIWLLENDNGNDKITDEEMNLLQQNKLKDKDIYNMKLERISEAELKSIDLNTAAIFRKIINKTALTPTIIKNENVTDKEYALISERLAELPGVDITTDWQRGYTDDSTLKSILGKVTSSDEGIPYEKLQYYQSKGYSLNDRIGKSYIEELFEDVLQGQKTKIKTVTDKKGNVVDTEIVNEGKSGKDVVLTIDLELQKRVEEIIEEELLSWVKLPRTNFLNDAFVVVMNPKTGEILSLAGKHYDRESKDIWDFAHGTFTAAYAPGSAIKGATVLMGYQTGVIQPHSRLLDEPLYFAGNTAPKKSVQTMGMVDDLTALERSSNVYMWKIAIAIGGARYIPHGPLKVDMNKINELRYYFNQFGLGVETGIGFSNEATGYTSFPQNPGNYIDFAIGQHDTYTPLQLAQYVSTIANGGYRVKPLLLKEIREPEINEKGLGPIIETSKPIILNKIDMQDEWIERVQQGFWRVTHGSRGTGRYYFSNEPYNAAGKTGTAQVPIYENRQKYDTVNLTFVGYAPFDNPEIAISVVVPTVYYGRQPSSTSINNVIAQKVFRAYFELKEERAKAASGAKQEETITEPTDENETTEDTIE
ncbi:peptidoglycan D,D-transpeptidase FtsI family protein [Bacillus kwashiorkori]|uniref:peptidoglycan D,D-transpeptidase FtsI family protein n=1 Tax=Bacillus kwashiorkori TaxID=1522318 RepID=UPI000783E8F3